MSKFNRNLSEDVLNQSKERSIDYVMSSIKKNDKKSVFTSHPIRNIALLFAFVFGVILFLNNDNDTPGPNPTVVLSSDSITRIADISYITSSLVYTSYDVNSNTSPIYLKAKDNDTAFENNIDNFHLYFDTLKVFLEDDLYQNSLEISELDSEEFQYLMEFSVEEEVYQFYLNITDSIIEGELHINERVLFVEGEVEDEDEKLRIDLTASNNLDQVEIRYERKQEDETEVKYEIKSTINGITSEKEFKISIEGNESKVEIKENENEYRLRKEVDDNQVSYRLDYDVNNQDGRVTILEVTDNHGNITYQYQIKENGVEKTVQKDKPNKNNKNNQIDYSNTEQKYFGI